tara:strand:- start:271 stop:669 length:399 start_codon:yes stop_codon:yes gene_type:complete
MSNNIILVCSAIICALILYQTVLIAPAINKKINAKDASVFLRFIWPKFFLVIGLISLFSSIFLFYYKLDQNILKFCSLFSFILMAVCYIITPIINKAKDESNEKKWKVLHLSTVIMTSLVLILNIILILRPY